MDPRHPELAVKRVEELVKQYKRVEKDMAKEAISAKLATLEREGVLVVQELCLVAPRLHEALMQASRERRQELTKILASPGKCDKTPEISRGNVMTPVEKPVENPKTKAKKATKKKVSK